MKALMNQAVRLFLVRTMVFATTLFFIDYLVGNVVRVAYFSQKIKLTYAIEETTDEVIIVGSSRANHHYVPSIISDSLNMTCYNLGMGGQNVYYDYGIICSILCRYKPKIIIVDLSSNDLLITDEAHNRDNISVFNPYFGKTICINEIIALRGKKEQIKFISETYPFNSQLTNVIYANVAKINYNMSMNGFIPIYGRSKFSTSSPTTESLKIDPTKVEYIEKIVRLCKENNVRLVFSISPSLTNDKQIINNFEFLSQLSNHHCVELYNFYSDSNFTDNYFLWKDSNHLNFKGAELFTNRFIINTPVKI